MRTFGRIGLAVSALMFAPSLEAQQQAPDPRPSDVQVRVPTRGLDLTRSLHRAAADERLKQAARRGCLAPNADPKEVMAERQCREAVERRGESQIAYEAGRQQMHKDEVARRYAARTHAKAKARRAAAKRRYAARHRRHHVVRHRTTTRR